MTNTVSLNKVWIARMAGLFILTALAIAYFAFPLLTMAQVVQGFKPLPKGYSLRFEGELLIPGTANLPVSAATVGAYRATRFSANDIKEGGWFACDVTAPDNQTYAMACSPTTTNGVTFTTKAGKPVAIVPVVIGQPFDLSMTSPTVIQDVALGATGTLTIPLDSQQFVVVPPKPLGSTGW